MASSRRKNDTEHFHACRIGRIQNEGNTYDSDGGPEVSFRYTCIVLRSIMQQEQCILGDILALTGGFAMEVMTYSYRLKLILEPGLSGGRSISKDPAVLTNSLSRRLIRIIRSRPKSSYLILICMNDQRAKKFKVIGSREIEPTLSEIFWCRFD